MKIGIIYTYLGKIKIEHFDKNDFETPILLHSLCYLQVIP